MNTQFDLGAMLSAPQTAIQQIPCDQLHPYHNHKFELYSGERLEDMVASIKENGVLSPIIVQPDGNGYEILIGHNRWNASKLAGLPTVPAIVKAGLTEEEAEMYVIESNVMQRGFENLRISEQAAAVALRHSEMFSQGKRNDILRELAVLENPSAEPDTATLNPVGSKLDTSESVGKEYGVSKGSVVRLIRINKLIDELKAKDYRVVYDLQEADTVDRGRIVGLLGPNGSGKPTLIKLLCGLLPPTAGRLAVAGLPVGPETKALVSYLPDRMYFASWMRAVDLFDLFRDFYRDFDYPKALAMCKSLGVEPKDRLKSMSKGTKEKVQLVLVMARKAQLYLLDEPIAGVDPAARDFILRTILTNYNEEGTVLISTHLIADIEKVLDEVILLKDGALMLHESVDRIREERGKSVDALFREIFRAVPMEGGEF